MRKVKSKCSGPIGHIDLDNVKPHSFPQEPLTLYPKGKCAPTIEIPVDPDPEPVHSVPEGGTTFALLGLAMFVLAAIRRRAK